MEIKISIPDELSQLFSESFSNKVNNEEKYSTFISLGVKLWLETLMGYKRHRSITEMYINWIREIFNSFLINDAPDEKNLVSFFNIPYGQAAYISRVLREEDTLVARQKWLATLNKVLNERKEEAKTWREDNRGEELMEFRLHKFVLKELEILMAKMIEDNHQIRPPRYVSKVSDYVFVNLHAAEVLQLIEFLNDKNIIKEN